MAIINGVILLEKLYIFLKIFCDSKDTFFKALSYFRELLKIILYFVLSGTIICRKGFVPTGRKLILIVLLVSLSCILSVLSMLNE